MNHDIPSDWLHDSETRDRQFRWLTATVLMLLAVAAVGVAWWVRAQEGTAMTVPTLADLKVSLDAAPELAPLKAQTPVEKPAEDHNQDADLAAAIQALEKRTQAQQDAARQARFRAPIKVASRPTQTADAVTVEGEGEATASKLAPGQVVAAVLESAVDSSHPGTVRALVTEPLYAQQGTQVVLPRLSRLIGRYQSITSAGPARVLIQWTQAIPPGQDAVVLNEYSGDPLGRAGHAGQVNYHLWQRYGAAMLFSLIDTLPQWSRDSGIAIRSGDAGNPASQILRQQAARTPTVTLPPGTPITVMVGS